MASVLLAVMALLGLVEVTAYLVVRNVMLSKLRQRLGEENLDADAEAKVLPVWQGLVLIRSAMMEGISLFALIITLVTGIKAALFVPALALIVFAVTFPTREKLVALTSSITGPNPYSS